MGASLSSEQANQISIGMETVALRVRQTSESAQALAEFLAAHPAAGRVSYPGLPSHPQHQRANAWLLSFELRDAARTNEFLNTLQVPIKATGLGDTRTLVIPVASTILWEAGPTKRKEMDIPDDLIRVSMGLEEIEDLVADFARAFDAMR